VLQLDSWSDRQVNPSLGRCKFSFVLIADTHVDRENLPSSSPFPVNQYANARTHFCIEDIQQLQNAMGQLAPKFVVHLGDLTHPVPSMPAYSKAVEAFHHLTAGLDLPFYLLPGNHDVGDKPVDWAPAGVVCDKFLSMWTKHFGTQYQTFSVEGVRFVLINAQLINSGLELEGQQRIWLEQTLDQSDNERIFLFSHYPPYLARRDEPENYDNLAEPGRSWILKLIQQHSIEALFAGHVHHFWYNCDPSTAIYLLPSTSFSRQDYSEMFRASPRKEMHDGRNDTGKIGYFVVLVYENGHVCHFRNTAGKVRENNQSTKKHPSEKRVIPFHTREVTHDLIGFDMRHPWNELIEIAPSGALDEFRRKTVRNDYPLFALWRMGVKRMRIPAEDLTNESTLARMQMLRQLGHEFVVITQGMPSEEVVSCVRMNQGLIKRWDVTLPIAMLEQVVDKLRALALHISTPLYLSKLRMKSDRVSDGEPYFHHISHGFTADDQDEIENLLCDFDLSALFDGLIFRLVRNQNVSASLARLAATCRNLNVAGSTTMFMADLNPAHHQLDDQINANRIAEGMFTCAVLGNLELFVDTFMDLDRGHSVRNGVIDRFCNPRSGMYVVQNMCAILSSTGDFSGRLSYGFSNSVSTNWVSLEQDRRRFILMLPNARSQKFNVIDSCGHLDLDLGSNGEATDLVSGKISLIKVEASADGVRIVLQNPLSGPLLINYCL